MGIRGWTRRFRRPIGLLWGEEPSKAEKNVKREVQTRPTGKEGGNMKKAAARDMKSLGWPEEGKTESGPGGEFQKEMTPAIREGGRRPRVVKNC